MSKGSLRVVVITHGEVGAELVDVATHIVGPIEGLHSVGIPWEAEAEAVIGRIEEAIERHGPDASLVILTDMFGGTSTNVGLSFLERGRIELVTGVNLPMLVKAATYLTGGDDAPDVSTVASSLRDQGRRSIEVASDLMEKR